MNKVTKVNGFPIYGGVNCIDYDVSDYINGSGILCANLEGNFLRVDLSTLPSSVTTVRFTPNGLLMLHIVNNKDGIYIYIGSERVTTNVANQGNSFMLISSGLSGNSPIILPDQVGNYSIDNLSWLVNALFEWNTLSIPDTSTQVSLATTPASALISPNKVTELVSAMGAITTTSVTLRLNGVRGIYYIKAGAKLTFQSFRFRNNSSQLINDLPALTGTLNAGNILRIIISGYGSFIQELDMTNKKVITPPSMLL